MKQGYTDIIIVLDRSGSMSTVKDDTIGGFNTFLADQKKLPGEAILTLMQFDHEYETVHAAKKIADVPPLTGETFVPRGNTALLDAIGRSINEAGKRFSGMPEDQRPEKVVCVIVTDGQENASKEFTRGVVFEMIKSQREKYNWQFVFMGANQDAIATAASMGIAKDSSLTYASNSRGTTSAFAALGSNVRSYRTGAAAATFSSSDRDEQKAAGATH